MIEIPSLRPETRYGMPMADLILINRLYMVGYSYLFRQARWAIELISEHTEQMSEKDLERLDNFREDLRVPEKFRATLRDYKTPPNRQPYDRGHLVSSADRLADAAVNSETFLMSNMSPQVPGFNRGIWKKLEGAVRDLAKKKNSRGKRAYVEVYAICGPMFEIGNPVDVIGKNKVVVPDAFFKSILAEQRRGKLEMWTFAFPNKKTNKKLSSFLVPTIDVEKRAGLQLWDRLRGDKSDKLKMRKGKMWTP